MVAKQFLLANITGQFACFLDSCVPGLRQPISARTTNTHVRAVQSSGVPSLEPYMKELIAIIVRVFGAEVLAMYPLVSCFNQWGIPYQLHHPEFRYSDAGWRQHGQEMLIIMALIAAVIESSHAIRLLANKLDAFPIIDMIDDEEGFEFTVAPPSTASTLAEPNEPTKLLLLKGLIAERPQSSSSSSHGIEMERELEKRLDSFSTKILEQVKSCVQDQMKHTI